MKQFLDALWCLVPAGLIMSMIIAWRTGRSRDEFWQTFIIHEIEEKLHERTTD